MNRSQRTRAERGPGTRGSASRPGDRWFEGYLFLLPAFAVYVAFVLVPALMTLYYSFFRWSGVGERAWVGAGNYARLLADDLFWKAIGNNALFLVFYTAIPIFLGLVLAAILHQTWLKGKTAFRTLLFLPQILPGALIGVIWRWLYNPAFGPLNRALDAVGLGALKRPWLGDFSWALPSVGLVASWYFYGFCMAVFVAGIQRIDASLYDAARMDGAGPFRQFLHVTLPGLRADVGVVLVFTFIAALKVFDLVFVTTRGGPGDQTLVASLYLYQNAFQQSRVGYGAAVAVAITLLVVAVTLAMRRFQEER